MRRISILSAIAVASVAFLIRAQEPADSGAIIRTETRVVLVDAVVTDKKGGYVHDLTAKDFKVFEDNKEQKITSFSFEADPASPLNSEPRYLVLFFDNSTMDLNDQAVARKAATQFITANAGPTRQMAIVNFGGSLQIAQNFTGDVERLKAVVSGIKTSVTTTMATGSGPMAQISRAEAGFGQRDSILALRSLAKSLAGVRGRKTLILLTAGFPLNEELMAEVTAAIDASNRSNVAIYPIDVRGLVASDGGHDDDAMLLHTPGKASPFTPAVYVPGSALDVALLDDRTPLVVMGLHLTPSGTNKFKASEKPIVYFEVYEPELLNSTRQKPVVVGLQVRVLERASGAQKADSGGYRIPIPDKPTSPVIPWGAKIPIEELKPGAYFVVIDAMDSAGRNKVRTAEFVIE